MGLRRVTPAWDDAALDRWREHGDVAADAAVAAYFAANDHAAAAPAGLFGLLVAHLRLPPEDQVPEIAAFLAAESALPEWADIHRVERGQTFFSDWLMHHFTALYLASLPNAYAAAKGSHVIWLTGRLRDDPQRRLNETAQFLMDVTAPGSFQAGTATHRILHVRLMHAAIRWLCDHDGRIHHPADASPAVMPDGLVWSPAWGRPVNQEDLAGTMLTFTSVVLEAFRRSGVEFDAAEAEDFFHLWRVIAHQLGVVDELIPADLASAAELQRRIFGRQHEASAVGTALNKILLDLLADRLPGPVARLGPPMLRRYVGDDVADLLGVPRSRGFGWILTLLVTMTRAMSWGRRYDPVPRWLSNWVGRHLLDGLLDADRHGERVPFDIPDRLRVRLPRQISRHVVRMRAQRSRR